MSSEGNVLNFFLSANTPHGFFSRFEQLSDPYQSIAQFIIKSGPGTGKSSLMKKIAKKAYESGESVELIHCSSDPGSLDGVILKNSKISIVDGTAPHVIEPKFPYAFENIITLYDLIDESKIRPHRDEIIELFGENKIYHERTCRFLSAAGSLLNDTYRIALDCTDTDKIGRYTYRLAHREFRIRKNAVSTEQIRFLSALTKDGIIMYTDTALKLCDSIYILDDSWGAVSRLILFALRSYAIAANHDIISCYCPVSPYDKLEHLFIPELRIGFITSNKWHKLALSDNCKTIHCSRFMNMEKFAEKKQRINFNRKAIGELLGEASLLMREAHNTHDKIEEYYINAMNFDALNEKTDKIIKDIFEKIK